MGTGKDMNSRVFAKVDRFVSHLFMVVVVVAVLLLSLRSLPLFLLLLLDKLEMVLLSLFVCIEEV